MSTQETAYKNIFDKILIFLIFILPVSAEWEATYFKLNLPSEILLPILLLLLAGLIQNEVLQFFRFPTTWVAMILLGWMWVTVPFSSDWLVSAKYTFIAEMHWAVFYIGFIYWYLKNPSKDFWWVGMYSLTFCLVIFFSWYNHAQYNFSISTSVLTARPFYFDHAQYSTAMLMLLPLTLVGSMLPARESGLSKNQKYLSLALSLIFIIGIYLSFSRATWLSAACILVFVFFIIILKFKIKHFAILGGSFLLLFYLNLNNIKNYISGNQAISKTEDLSHHIQSITNLTKDVSNKERLNRYSCAWRMFVERPVAGFGSGTFASAYLPFQREEEMTRISVTTSGDHPPGRGGGAHSEYLQALSENGIIGGLCWLFFLGFTFLTTIKIYHSKLSKRNRWIGLALGLGLLSYFIHAFFNNFLHQDKIAILFWSFLAWLSILYNK